MNCKQPLLGVALLATACASDYNPRIGGGSIDAGGLIEGVAVVASLPIEAVNLLADWERVEQEAPLPWLAPDRRVAAYTKDRVPTAIDTDSEKYRWRVGEEMIVPGKAYSPRISDAIVADPISKNWEFSGEYVKHPGKQFSRPELMPDYDFYLVSIQPMAVVMVHTGVHRRARYLPNKRAKLSDWGAIPDKSIRYSTRFPAPAGRQLLWFSPDLKVAPQPVTFNDAGAFTAKFRKSQMTCTRTGDTVDCRRSVL